MGVESRKLSPPICKCSNYAGAIMVDDNNIRYCIQVHNSKIINKWQCENYDEWNAYYTLVNG